MFLAAQAIFFYARHPHMQACIFPSLMVMAPTAYYAQGVPPVLSLKGGYNFYGKLIIYRRREASADGA